MREDKTIPFRSPALRDELSDLVREGAQRIIRQAVEAELNAFLEEHAGGNDVFTVYAALKGTATYEGVATDMYSAAGKVQYFDADVSLIANFGGNVGADPVDATNDTEGDDLLGAVTGSVSNIKAGGMDIEGMLTLKKANIIDGNDYGSHAGGFSSTVWGTLAGRAISGNWGG